MTVDECMLACDIIKHNMQYEQSELVTRSYSISSTPSKLENVLKMFLISKSDCLCVVDSYSPLLQLYLCSRYDIRITDSLAFGFRKKLQ